MYNTGTETAPYLTDVQQELLTKALSSNTTKSKPDSTQPTAAEDLSKNSKDDMNVSMYATGHQPMPDSGVSNGFEVDDTPYIDYLDGDTSLDFDADDLGGQSLIGGLPGDSYGPERHEKRKNSDVDGDEETGNTKRKEGEDKQAKKPGRKPLMSEPTTKRKAQNRAAQRAFRERKEQHLKDLETRVEELTKSSEERNHENGLLKTQVERLQAELVSYRKRMSADASRNRSPPSHKSTPYGVEPPKETFAFDFPTFGGVTGTGKPQVFGQSNHDLSRKPTMESHNPSVDSVRPSNTRQGSSEQRISPSGHSRVSQPASTEPSLNNLNASGSVASDSNPAAPQNSVDGFAGLFSPSLLHGTKFGTENNDYGFSMLTASPKAQTQTTTQDTGTDSNSGLSRVFRFNSGSISSNTDSPSLSSLSQSNANSSCHTSPCNTSPEPSHSSFKKESSQLKTYNNNNNLNLRDASDDNALNTVNPSQGRDWLTTQNGGQFDPVLFGDYRESQDAIVGDGDFNNGFFNDAFAFDFGTPLNFDLTLPKGPRGQTPTSTPRQLQQQQPQQMATTTSASQSALANVEKIREGFEEAIDQNCPLAGQKKPTAPNMLNANTIWNQLQSNKDFQDGKFDLDSLCSELRAKAKCSESGVVVAAADVDKAFERLSDTRAWDPYYSLVWQKDHVDDAVKKLGTAGSNWGGMGI